MRGSIVCIAIFCLSHVSSVPTVEEGKTFFKSYTFEKGEVINSFFPFWKDEAVFAVCEGSGVEKKCKIYVQSANQDKDSLQSCDLNLTYSGSFDRNVYLFNAGNSKAVFVVGDGDNKLKLISVNLKGCHIKETSIEFVKEYPQRPMLNHFIYFIPREKNFELLFLDSKLCPGGVCKATYDYEGNLVKAASKLSAAFEGFDQILYANNTYVVAKRQSGSVKVYLVRDGEDQKDNVPSVVSIESREFLFGLSADENKIGVCSHGDGKVLCKQIHTEGEPRTINIEFPFHYHPSSYHFLDVLNLEKGLLQLSVRVKNLINVTHFDEAGKPGKSVQVDPKCQEDNALLTKLYKNNDGQYCVNSFCLKSFDESDRSKFSITNKCLLKTELF